MHVPPPIGLLARLDRDIATSRIPRELPYLRAERAVLLVRMGEQDRAQADLAIVRASPDATAVPALGAWIWLIEGLMDYFGDSGTRARTLIQRATAVARTARSPRIHALTSAWSAHFSYHARDFPGVIAEVAEVFRVASPDHHSALSRACIVLAVANQCLNDEPKTQLWYTRARSHATLEGDGATLSSIVYNMTALRIHAVRLAEHFGEVDAKLARRALLGAESSTHLDEAVQTFGLSALTWLQRAQILCVLGEYAEAVRLFDQEVEPTLTKSLEQQEAQVVADKAWCLYQLGRGDEARALARHASAAISWTALSDTRAIAHAQIARTCAGLGMAKEAQEHAVAAQADLADHQAEFDKLREGMNPATIEAMYQALMQAGPRPTALRR
jgi:tetratricopeptide (TPR) repeat protein